MSRLSFIAALLLFSPALWGEKTDLASLLVPLDQMREEAAPLRNADSEPSAKAAQLPVAEKTDQQEAATPQPEKKTSVYVSRNEILDELRSKLEERFKPEGRLILDSGQTWRPLPAKDADWTMELTRISSQTLEPRLVANFRILDGGEILGEFQIQLTCSLLREVLVSSRRFNKGEDVTMDDLQVQVRDILDEHSAPVPVGQDIGGYETRGGVAPGSVIYWRDLELKPLVRRGQIVEAVASEGLMRIAVKAMVMEDGREGDVIHVRNLSSNRDIQAKILNENTVQVYF